MPRHQTLAFAYEMRESEEVMALGVTLESGDGFRGTWSAMVKDLPRMEWGYYMDPLDEHCTLDPEYGAVLACWSLPTEETVHQGANGQMRVDYIPPEWTGAVEEPQVEAGECFLLLRLLVQ